MAALIAVSAAWCVSAVASAWSDSVMVPHKTEACMTTINPAGLQTKSA